jgi:hypothetical protein
MSDGVKRCSRHLAPDADIEALILEAQQSELDRAHAELLADEEIVETGVIRRYFETEITVR